MKPQHYLERVEKTEDYKKLVREDPGIYLCSMFFVRDFEENHNETQIDFYSPKAKKIISFKVDGKVERIPLDKKAETLLHKTFVPARIDPAIKLEIDKIKPIIMDDMHNRGLTDTINKILVILQNVDDRNIWNSTCFLKGMGLLQAHVEDSSASVLFMDKKSFLDMIKFIGKPEDIPVKDEKGNSSTLGDLEKTQKALAKQAKGKKEAKPKKK
jgi:hypothetical protein